MSRESRRGAGRVLLVLPLLLATVACDQTSKWLAVSMLEDVGPYSFLGGAVTFLYTENSGAFLGLGADLEATTRFWLFVVGVSLLLGLFGYRLVAAASRLEALGWAFVVGGGLGNLIDRLVNGGYVVDFLRVGVGGLRTGVFNLADAAVVLGLAALLAASLLVHPASDSA